MNLRNEFAHFVGQKSEEFVQTDAFDSLGGGEYLDETTGEIECARVGGFLLGEFLGECEMGSFDVVDDDSRGAVVFYLQVARYCEVDDIELKRLVGSKGRTEGSTYDTISSETKMATHWVATRNSSFLISASYLRAAT